MPNDRRIRPLKKPWFTLLAFLLLWNSGENNSLISTFDEKETSTPTSIRTDTISATDFLPTETPAPPSIPADSTDSPEPVPTNTFSQNGENDSQEAEQRPLPAAFAAGTYVQDELVVRFKPSTSRRRIEECFQGIDIQVQSEIEALHTFVLSTASGETAKAFYHVMDCAGALYVEPNFLLQAADTIPNDPNWGVQYGLSNIHAPQGWDISTGSPAITIAILDTGVDQGHLDLAGKTVAGYDFVNNDENPQDDNGHGTHVAGIAAASSNNSAGIAGVSWGARIMPIKVLNAFGSGSYANTANGLIWAVEHGAQVINLSLGGAGQSTILEDAINYAHSQGVVVVAAAGNTGINFVLYPARYPNVIAVARTDSANHWNGSNYGPEIDVAAPGAGIFSTVIGGYDYKSGSSMSTGFVSGLAAILMGIPGNASPDLIKTEMESTALDIEFSGWDEYTGAGLIQMDAAIALAVQSSNPPGNPTSPSTGAGAESGPLQSVFSNTPSPAQAPSVTAPTTVTTVTIAPEPGPTGTLVETPGNTPFPTNEEAGEVEAQEGLSINRYILPCLGVLLILSGLFVIWIFKSKKQGL